MVARYFPRGNAWNGEDFADHVYPPVKFHMSPGWYSMTCHANNVNLR